MFFQELLKTFPSFFTLCFFRLGCARNLSEAAKNYNHKETLLKPRSNSVISHSPIPSTPDNRPPTVETPPDLAPLTRLIATGLNNIEQCLLQLLQLHTAQEKPINATEKLITQNSMQRPEKVTS
jgi:hypothetical protein